jgi:hypothetical protein
MEEYPLSRAFVSLLLALCRGGAAPRALGAGTRAPGLQPYLHHVLHRLALPAPHRPHSVPHHKWQVLLKLNCTAAEWNRSDFLQQNCDELNINCITQIKYEPKYWSAYRRAFSGIP